MIGIKIFSDQIFNALLEFNIHQSFTKENKKWV